LLWKERRYAAAIPWLRSTILKKSTPDPSAGVMPDLTYIAGELYQMKYDTAALPIGSVARAKAQLTKLDLVRAVKTARRNAIELADLEPELGLCIDSLYRRGASGVILSAYYNAGACGRFTVTDLLRRTFQKGDYPSFLKQAYRFDAYQGFSSEIERAIVWHCERHLTDAEAWRRKFGKLREHCQLRDPDAESQVITEEFDDDVGAAVKVFTLRPLAPSKRKSPRACEEPADDPYIVSQVARVKVEQASRVHGETLELLRRFLYERRVEVASSKLIDAFSVLNSGPAIFEVKSITDANERQQIRHAVSQLYEYRFLHSLFDASLWMVFSAEPSSIWLVEYLLHDREFRLVWVDNGKLVGPSVAELR
jgi:hypothetical protein